MKLKWLAIENGAKDQIRMSLFAIVLFRPFHAQKAIIVFAGVDPVT
jgi:hypothetical protein